MEAWDFAASRSPHYRRILALLAAIDRRLHGHTKYSTMARYRLADRLYLLTPRGLITPAEAPASWGVLEVEPEPLREVGRLLSPGRGARTDRKAALLHLETDPDWWLGFRVRVRMDDPLEARPERRAALLRNIAAANTRRQYGRSVLPERTLFGAPPALPAPLL
jgi:hypothetical protein